MCETTNTNTSGVTTDETYITACGGRNRVRDHKLEIVNIPSSLVDAIRRDAVAEYKKKLVKYINSED